jgi:hypothetical protein
MSGLLMQTPMENLSVQRERTDIRLWLDLYPRRPRACLRAALEKGGVLDAEATLHLSAALRRASARVHHALRSEARERLLVKAHRSGDRRHWLPRIPAPAPSRSMLCPRTPTRRGGGQINADFEGRRSGRPPANAQPRPSTPPAGAFNSGRVDLSAPEPGPPGSQPPDGRSTPVRCSSAPPGVCPTGATKPARPGRAVYGTMPRRERRLRPKWAVSSNA